MLIFIEIYAIENVEVKENIRCNNKTEHTVKPLI